MSKEKKSMDDVLDSIRRIIRTDPTAAPPDASTLPRGGAVADQTARDVLDRLRRDQEGGGTGKPLSTSDDPDESARAILDHLRQQAEAEARNESGPAATPGEAPDLPAGGDAATGGPPAAAKDSRDAPPAGGESASDSDEKREDAPSEPEPDEPLALGEDAGRRVMRPRRAPPPAPELPQPGREPAHPERDPNRDAPVMIDEAALEAMIRRVVRDELMGEMGRRVTRNVVKLIKDEIARSRIDRK